MHFSGTSKLLKRIKNSHSIIFSIFKLTSKGKMYTVRYFYNVTHPYDAGKLIEIYIYKTSIKLNAGKTTRKS